MIQIEIVISYIYLVALFRCYDDDLLLSQFPNNRLNFFFLNVQKHSFVVMDTKGWDVLTRFLKTDVILSKQHKLRETSPN